MAWTNPKENWLAADAVANTDLNEIGGNLTYLKEDVWCSYRMGSTPSLGAGVTYYYTQWGISVPDDYRISLRKISFSGFDSNLEVAATAADLGAALSSTAIYLLGPTDATATGYAEPAQILGVNISGGAIHAVVSLGFKNTSGSPITMDARASTSALVAVEAVP